MGIRETWVYPEHGEPYLKGTRHAEPTQRGPVVLGDLPDFVSPLDGRSYSGRAGLRDHCRRHDVVPNADLKGLPTLTAQSDMRTREQKQFSEQHRKQQIINQVNKHYR